MRALVTGALLLGLLAPTAAAAANAPEGDRSPVVVPTQLPKGGHPTKPWVDTADQVIHDGTRTITLTPRLPGQRLIDVWRAGADYLARGSQGIVYRVAADGTYTQVLSGADDALEVEDTGSRFAALVLDPTTRLTTVVVVQVADGAVVARLGSEARDLFDFTDGIVTLDVPKRQGRTYSRLATWDVALQRVRLAGRRLADPLSVDVDAGLAVVNVYLSNGFEGSEVRPLQRGDFTPWRAALSSLESVSPNGRRAVTYRLSGEDSGDAPGTLTVRDARTGAPQRVIRVVLGGVSGWESNRSLLFNAYAEKKDGYALVRLDVRTGRLERVSGYSLNDVDRLFAGS